MMRKIAIVPGHGGADPGGTGINPATGGVMRESKINLNVALKLKELLEHDGYQVAISRTSDAVYMSPTEQLRFVNASGADIAVAIHENDAANETAKGSEVFYQPTSEKGRRLANYIDLEFKRMGQTSRGVKTFERKIAVMGAKIPTVLTEYAFLTKADITDVDTLAEHHAQARAIRNAIMRLDGGL